MSEHFSLMIVVYETKLRLACMCDCDTHQLGSPVSSTSSLLHYCNAYKLISYKMAGQFSCFGCLLTLFTEELLTAAKTLVDSYPNDLDSSFVDELCHFAKFADIFKDDEPGNISTELYKLIIYKSVHDTFPNVAIALRM